MPAEKKKAAEPAINPTTPDERNIAHLKAKEANLKRKIDERIPQFSEETRSKALERAQRDLQQVQAKLREATK